MLKVSLNVHQGFPFSFVFSDALFNCPEGAQEFGDFCYYFYATTLTWLDADLECRETHGGHLVSIHKINEIGFLEANVAQNAQFGTRTWIGFRDSGSNGEFDWVDDSLRQITYWAPGEPSNPIGIFQIFLFFSLAIRINFIMIFLIFRRREVLCRNGS